MFRLTKIKHQRFALLALLREIYQWPVGSLHRASKTQRATMSRHAIKCNTCYMDLQKLLLSQWVLNKMADILQTTFASTCEKSFVFWFEFHWNLFPRPLYIFIIRPGDGLAPNKRHVVATLSWVDIKKYQIAFHRKKDTQFDSITSTPHIHLLLIGGIYKPMEVINSLGPGPKMLATLKQTVYNGILTRFLMPNSYLSRLFPVIRI